jgi:uncharacterized membrane protein YeaQ/YmgE (transglycosylase-associated protein family)
MDLLTLMTVAVLVGWLATLIMYREIDQVSLRDFAVAVLGAALAGGLLAPLFEISVTGEYGLTILGTLVAWVGATTLLGLVNLLRFGSVRCTRRPAARG